MAKYVSASAAARILGMNEKTVRNWIERGEIQAHQVTKKRFNISMDEVHRIAAKRGVELAPDTEVSIASLDLEMLKLRDRIEQLEQLRERVEQLEYRLERSEKPVAPSTSSASAMTMKEKRQHTSLPVEAKNTLPDGYRSFTDFFKQHGIPETTAGRGVQAASIEVKRGNWRTAAGKPVKNALDADGQRAFCTYFAGKGVLQACSDEACVCHE